jgi:hypothetical protein
MHLDDELIQRVLHGELSARDRAVVDAHVTGCTECRLRLEDSRREEEEIFSRFRLVDRPAPAVDPELVAARARRTGLRWGQRAAAVLLGLAAAGAAYAAPGSPLPSLAHRIVEWFGPPSPARPIDPRVEPTPPEPVTAGVAVLPGERLTVRFQAAQPAGHATVSLTDGATLSVRALNGTATFTTDAERLSIENARSMADYEIDVPRDARWVEILLGSNRLLLKQGRQVVTDILADSSGHWVLPLTPAGH